MSLSWREVEKDVNSTQDTPNIGLRAKHKQRRREQYYEPVHTVQSVFDLFWFHHDTVALLRQKVLTMSNNPQPPVIQIDNVQVDHSKTIVYKQPEKKTFVPAFAQQQLKSTAGGNTRTFKGGTTVVSKSSGPVIVSKGPSITPKKPSSGPQISVTTATGDAAPKRIIQPHAQPQVAAAPVAYVPEQRLYKPKLDDKAYLKKEEDSDVAAPVLTPAPPTAPAAVIPPPAPAPQPVAAPAPPPPAAAPVASAPPAAAAPASTEPQAAQGSGEGGVAGAPSSGANNSATGTPAAAPASVPQTTTTTTTTTVTTTTVEQDGGCCVIL